MSITEPKGGVVVRTYQASDRDEVLSLCFAHFKKLAIPSVQYYVIRHKLEILVLILMGLFQTSYKNVLANIVIFGIHLYVKATLELRSYIKNDCSDLEAIQMYYLKKPKSNFWVAEFNGRIVGCAGLTKSRHHGITDAQLVRLVVDPNMRRQQIGTKLLDVVEELAVQEGYERIHLNTSSLSSAHILFVMIRGFVMTACIPRNMMRGDLLKWRKDVGGAALAGKFTASRLAIDDQNVY